MCFCVSAHRQRLFQSATVCGYKVNLSAGTYPRIPPRVLMCLTPLLHSLSSCSVYTRLSFTREHKMHFPSHFCSLETFCLVFFHVYITFNSSINLPPPFPGLTCSQSIFVVAVVDIQCLASRSVKIQKRYQDLLYTSLPASAGH